MNVDQLRSQLADRPGSEPVFVAISGQRDEPREIVGIDFDERLTGSDAVLIVAEPNR